MKRKDYSVRKLLGMSWGWCTDAFSGDIRDWWPAIYPEVPGYVSDETRAMLVLYRVQQHSLHTSLQEQSEIVILGCVRGLLLATSKLSERHLSVHIETHPKGRYITFVGHTKFGKAFLDSLEQEELAYVLTS